jgi:hypothetical protein
MIASSVSSPVRPGYKPRIAAVSPGQPGFAGLPLSGPGLTRSTRGARVLANSLKGLLDDPALDDVSDASKLRDDLESNYGLEAAKLVAKFYPDLSGSYYSDDARFIAGMLWSRTAFPFADLDVLASQLAQNAWADAHGRQICARCGKIRRPQNMASRSGLYDLCKRCDIEMRRPTIVPVMRQLNNTAAAY